MYNFRWNTKFVDKNEKVRTHLGLEVPGYADSAIVQDRVVSCDVKVQVIEFQVSFEKFFHACNHQVWCDVVRFENAESVELLHTGFVKITLDVLVPEIERWIEFKFLHFYIEFVEFYLRTKLHIQFK